MKVHFGQIYIKPGICFGFSHNFQIFLGEAITRLLGQSLEFASQYGDDFDLMFRISAKQQIAENEIRGPTVYKKDKDIEYTIFLPYDVIKRDQNVMKCALGHLLDGVVSICDRLSIDATKIKQEQESLIEQICADNSMYE